MQLIQPLLALVYIAIGTMDVELTIILDLAQDHQDIVTVVDISFIETIADLVLAADLVLEADLVLAADLVVQIGVITDFHKQDTLYQ